MCFAPFLLTAQDRPQQRVVLTNPTPREPDLEKRFVTNKPAPADPARVAAYKQQRLQLTGQAAKHLYEMSTTLEDSMAKDQVATRTAQEAKLMEYIETLAGNVYTAMSGVPAQHDGKKDDESAAPEDGAVDAPDLLAETRRLTELTAALQFEISKSTVDTLPAGVLVKSSQVRQLAHTLKQRLQLSGKQ